MENNEIMKYEETEIVDDVVVAEEKSGVGTGTKLLIAAGVIAAGTAVVKLVKKGIAKWKAKKELRQPDEEIEVDFEDVEDIAAEE